VVQRTNKQVQLYAYHQPRRAGATEPEEDKLMTELEQELLAALEAMLNLTLDEDDIAVSSRIANARAVIAKAKRTS
jgi:hypothetical protein